MDRKEIKESAKQKIKGNLWNLVWPMLVIGALSSIVSGFFGNTVVIDVNNLNDISSAIKVDSSFSNSAGSLAANIVIGMLGAGYLAYVISFVKTGKFDRNRIINTIKNKWLDLLIAYILTSIIVLVCCLLLVVPGIIMAFAYTMVTYLIIQTDISGSDSLKKSREIMQGYKFDYFVFQLSFIGWYLLTPFTLFILLIWLEPYKKVSEAIYFEELYKKVKSK